jgi:4-hydroxy-2-oxoheptanedioate aldolase
MLNENFLLEKLKNSKEVCFGSWLVISNPMLIEIICKSNIDFVIFDSEHGPWGLNETTECSIICESQNVSPVMRVSDIQRGKISKALDIGLHAIQVPNVGNRKQAKEVVNYSKYSPIGIRGFSPFTRACNYSSDFSEEMINKSNENSAVIIHIEDRDGINNIDEILKQDSIDIIFIGLFDLSVMLSLPGQIDHQDVLQQFIYLSKKVLASGKILGSIATNKDQLPFLIKNKVRYLTYSADCQLINDVYKGIFNNLKGY